jgi:hypothetical protein
VHAACQLGIDGRNLTDYGAVRAGCMSETSAHSERDGKEKMKR